MNVLIQHVHTMLCKHTCVLWSPCLQYYTVKYGVTRYTWLYVLLLIVLLHSLSFLPITIPHPPPCVTAVSYHDFPVQHAQCNSVHIDVYTQQHLKWLCSQYHIDESVFLSPQWHHCWYWWVASLSLAGIYMYTLLELCIINGISIEREH